MGASWEPGDLVFCHTKGIFGSAIRFGEWLRFREGSFWSHVAILIRPHGDDWVIGEAVARGVRLSLLSTVAIGGTYEIVSLPYAANRSKSLEFVDGELRDGYGFLTIVYEVLRILLPRWFPLPTFRMRSTWICSALAGESARCAGWIHRWGSIYDPVPSELYAAFKNTTAKGAYSASTCSTQEG